MLTHGDFFFSWGGGRVVLSCQYLLTWLCIFSTPNGPSSKGSSCSFSFSLVAVFPSRLLEAVDH